MVWLLDAVATVVVAAAIGQVLTIPQGLVLLDALGLSGAVPSTRGYVGVRHFVARAVLPLFGFPDAIALAYVIALQALTVVLMVLWGGLGLWRLSGPPSDH